MYDRIDMNTKKKWVREYILLLYSTAHIRGLEKDWQHAHTHIHYSTTWAMPEFILHAPHN